MESAENREQSPKTNQPEESNDTDTQSLSKIETIQLLNDSIDRLESTIKEISGNSTKTLPSPDSINTLLNTTQELADSVAPPPPTPEEIVQENPTSETITQKDSPLEDETKSTPAKEVKSKIQSTESQNKRSPETSKAKNSIVNNKKKEKRGLMLISGIAIAIIAVALVWLCLPQIKALISSSPEIAEIVDPEDFPNLSPTQKINPNLESPNIPIIDSDNPTPEVAPDNLPLNTPASDVAAEAPTDIVIPPDLASPGRAKNLKIVTIEPELTFSPEQTLVAALQGKLAALTENYDPDLFEQVQVDVEQMNLSIAVTDNWYKLSESRQAKLANEILKRSRQLNFSKLEFQDPTGNLVARNPVVGDRIIIIQNTQGE